MVPKSIKIGPQSCLGGVLGHLGPKMAPRAVKKQKNESFERLLGATLGPKSIKNGSGSEHVRPETAPEAVFVGFSCRCHLESLSAPILARFFTENHA